LIAASCLQDQILYICLECLQRLNSFVTYSPLDRGNRIWCLELKLPITSSNPDSNPWLIEHGAWSLLIVLVKSCPSGVYPLLNLLLTQPKPWDLMYWSSSCLSTFSRWWNIKCIIWYKHEFFILKNVVLANEQFRQLLICFLRFLMAGGLI
jgi:hypothetical protein